MKIAFMKTKMFIAVAFIIMVQLTSVKAQIQTSIQTGVSGSSFSLNIGTNTNLNKPALNSNINGRNNNFNSCCNSNNTCNPKANCCGQKHGNKKHKHNKHDQCNNSRNDKKSNCCKKHDD